MALPFDFYFDFASPYAYLAACQIDDIAARHGRSVNWRPFMLAAAFKATGAQAAIFMPLRSDYLRHDAPRYARLLGVPFTLPEGFPMMALAPSRAYYWLLERDADLAKAFARAVFHAYFGEGRDMSKPEAVAEVVRPLGVEPASVLAALQEQRVKDKLKDETEKAIAQGVFGSPFILLDGEAFWGADRLWQVERWLETGGW